MYFNKINRRNYLKLASSLLAGSILPSLSTAVRAQNDSRPPLRFLVVTDSYGLGQDDRANTWIGSQVGDYELKPEDLGFVLAPFEPFLDNMMVISGMNSTSRIHIGGGNSHDNFTAHCLTGSRGYNGRRRFQYHESIDQHIGHFLHNDYGLQFPRVYPHLLFANSSGGSPAGFSFKPGGGRASALFGAEQIINSVFGSTSNNVNLETQNLALQHIQASLTELRPQLLNANKSVVMDAYQTSVESLTRELELRTSLSCNAPEVLEDSPQGTAAIFDAIYNIFACDLVSTIIYSIGKVQFNWSAHGFLTHEDPEVQAALGLPFHQISHTNTEPNLLAQAVIREWQATLIANLLQRLRNTPEGDGTALDNTVVFYTSTMSHNVHAGENYAHLIIAGKNSNLKGGWHYDCRDISGNDLLTTLGQGFTSPITRYGGYDAAGEYVGDPINGGPISKMLINTLS